MLLKRNTNYYKIAKYQLGLNRCTCSLFAIKSQKPIKIQLVSIVFGYEYFFFDVPNNNFILTNTLLINLYKLKD